MSYFRQFKMVALTILMSSLLTKLLLFIFKRWRPKEEATAIPPYGGIAVFSSFWLAFFITFPSLRFHSEQWNLFLSSAVILLTGIIDDRYNLKPWQKSIGILLGANMAYFMAGIEFTSSLLPSIHPILLKLLSYLLTIGWIYFVTNAVNFMDGLDGLASSVSVVSLLALALISYMFSQSIRLTSISMLVLLAAAILGFLPFNWYPAKIYLGDTGALFIGFMYAVLTVSNLKNASFFSLLVPIIIYALPLFDTSYATVRRWLSGQSIVKRDEEHMHHRLVRSGFSVPQVVGIMVGLTLGFSLLAIVVQSFPQHRLTMMGLVVIAIVILVSIMQSLKGNSEDEL